MTKRERQRYEAWKDVVAQFSRPGTPQVCPVLGLKKLTRRTRTPSRPIDQLTARAYWRLARYG